MGCKSYLTLFLKLVSRVQKEAKAKFKFSLIEANKVKKNKIKSRGRQKFVIAGGDGFCDLNHRNALNNCSDDHLDDNEQCFHYEILATNDYKAPSCKNSSISSKNAEDLQSDETLSYSIENNEEISTEYSNNLFGSQFLSDVILVANGKDIFAHKAILASSSPVFFAMFSHQTQENLQNRVDVEDIDYEVLKEMLRFVYTGKTPNLKEMASTLFSAADKYGLQQLRGMCEETLAFNLSVENVSQMIILADAHNANMLKTCAINFINAHSLAVTTTSGWSCLYQQHPRLIAEAYLALIRE